MNIKTFVVFLFYFKLDHKKNHLQVNTLLDMSIKLRDSNFTLFVLNDIQNISAEATNRILNW